METNRMTIIRNNPQPRLSASVAYGDLLVLSGQTPKSNEDDIVLQTREVLEKIDALLAAKAAGSRPASISIRLRSAPAATEGHGGISASPWLPASANSLLPRRIRTSSGSMNREAE